MSKKFIGYTGPFPKPTGNEFDGLKKSLEQDEKLYVEEGGSMTEDTTKQVLAYLEKRNKAYSLILKEPTDCPITFGDNVETLTFKHKDKSVTLSLEKLLKTLMSLAKFVKMNI